METVERIAPELGDELVALARDLVRTPSVNGVHPERAVAELGAAWARRHGLWADLPAREAARPNLLVRAGPPGEPGLLLVAHLDTVAVGDESAWTRAPFGGEVAGGRLYGRGAIDTKGGLAAALAALVLAERAGLRRPVLLAGVPDEEAGATGVLGVRHLRAEGLLAGRGAIYAYPGSDEIVLGHRGVLRLAITVRGRSMHSGSREWQELSPGPNPVAAVAEALAEVERLRFDDAAPGTLFAPYRTVLTPTTIAGGSGPSMVPGSCTARVDIRLVPAAPLEAVERAVREAVARVVARRPPLTAEVAVETVIPPTEIREAEPVVLAARAAAREVLGRDPAPAVSGPANESYILNGFGIPTCIIGADGANAHAPDEYVEVASLLPTARLYARVALELDRGD